MMKKEKIVAFIQARMASTRLYGKVLMKMAGATVIEHVVRRARLAPSVSEVVVATSVNRENLPLVALCAGKDIHVYTGDEADVLNRFYQAAKLFEADHVVRLVADCPVLDPIILDQVIRLHLEKGADFTCNNLDESFPDGLDVEVCTFQTLERCWRESTLWSEREHVTPYLKKNPEKFKHAVLKPPVPMNDKRWTLDEERDLHLLTAIFDGLYADDPAFGMEKILNFLKEHPELEGINASIQRNEGYLKSLRNESIFEGGNK